MSPDGAVAIEIAGARLKAVPSDPSIKLGLSATAQAFACETSSPDILATVGTGDLSRQSFGQRLLFDSGSLWQLWDDGDAGGSILRLASPFFGPTPYKTIRLNAAWTRAEMTMHTGYTHARTGQGALDPFEYPLDELLITQWLSRGRGLELHACGIVDEQGQGYIFCGQSGAGKSTTARSWLSVKPGTVLSDDRIVVRFEDGRFWMYGTPWHGEAALATAMRAPLAAILLLRQAPRARLVKIAPVQAVARLLACAFFPLYDRAAIGFGMECASHLVGEVPCLELELDRSPSFLRLLPTI